jgi:hypothetical protein
LASKVSGSCHRYANLDFDLTSALTRLPSHAESDLAAEISFDHA